MGGGWVGIRVRRGGSNFFFKNNKRGGSFTRNLIVHLLLFNLRNEQLFDKGVGIFSNPMGKICCKYVISLGERPSYYFWYSADSGEISRYEKQLFVESTGLKEKDILVHDFSWVFLGHLVHAYTT